MPLLTHVILLVQYYGYKQLWNVNVYKYMVDFRLV